MYAVTTAESDQRTLNVIMKATDDERQGLKEFALRNRVTMSVYIRSLLVADLTARGETELAELFSR